MATKLKKSVAREVSGWCIKGLFGMGGRSDCKPLIVGLEPGPVLTFREKGRRKVYEIDLESVFNLAVRRTIAKEEAEKVRERKALGLPVRGGKRRRPP